MPALLCPIASGSAGNSLLVATGKTTLLVDMGISERRLKAGLRQVGVAPEEIRAVLLTHTHGDHFGESASRFCRENGTRVYSTEANLRYLTERVGHFRALADAGLAEPINGQTFLVGDVAVEAFDVPHDSPGQCLGFRLTMGSVRRRRVVSVATDLGHMPPDCAANFLDSDAVVLESNHDPAMLRASGRPWDLIERIAGDYGHLSNDTAAEALAEIVGRSHPGKVAHVILAHLSRDCNHPRLALAAQSHLSRHHSHPIHLAAAAQDEAGPMIEL